MTVTEPVTHAAKTINEMYGMAGMGLVVLIVVCVLIFVGIKYVAGPVVTAINGQNLKALQDQAEASQRQMSEQKAGYLSLINEIRAGHSNEIEARDKTLVDISRQVGQMANAVDQLRAHVTTQVDALRREFHAQLSRQQAEDRRRERDNADDGN